MVTILENEMIEKLAAQFSRSPLQLNRLQESDAELVRLPDSGVLLALTTDGIVEEIDTGLYTDPYLIGWMTVMVNASDLAAVGAEPIGLLVNETIPPGIAEEFLEKLQKGIQDACAACGMFILGGDTNFCSRLQMSACAVGLIPGGRPLTRLGCKPGDVLFASGRLGLGSAYASGRLGIAPKGGKSSVPFLPSARLREGRIVSGVASCCMDTSDGLFATLDQLMRLNNAGFVLDTPPAKCLHREALHICRDNNIPEWMMLAGPHGEFELVFCIPPADTGRFFSRAAGGGWEPIRLGEVVEQPGVWWSSDGRRIPIDTGRIRNLFAEVQGNISEYMKGLLLIGERDGLGRKSAFGEDAGAPMGDG